LKRVKGNSSKFNGSGFGASVGAVYHVNESFGITADYQYHPDNEIGIWGFGARFSF